MNISTFKRFCLVDRSGIAGAVIFVAHVGVGTKVNQMTHYSCGRPADGKMQSRIVQGKPLIDINARTDELVNDVNGNGGRIKRVRLALKLNVFLKL